MKLLPGNFKAEKETLPITLIVISEETDLNKVSPPPLGFHKMEARRENPTKYVINDLNLIFTKLLKG